MRLRMACFCFVALAAVSILADEAEVPRITVYGTATTEVVPDQMIWSLKVENKGPNLELIAADHAKTVQALLKFLKDSKVEDKTVQTSRMEFGENWEYKSNSRVREGYFASTDVSFKIADLDLYKTLWLGLAKMSAVRVEDIAYDHSKRIEFQNQTREKALLAAKQKAAALAETVGSKLGEPLLIEEEISISEGWQRNVANRVVNNLRALDGTESGKLDNLAPGTIPITMRMKTAFRLTTPNK